MQIGFKACAFGSMPILTSKLSFFHALDCGVGFFVVVIVGVVGFVLFLLMALILIKHREYWRKRTRVKFKHLSLLPCTQTGDTSP